MIRLGVEGRAVQPLKLAHSNNVLGSPDCRMIDIKVPIRSSLWSGTGTVVVSPPSTRCISMWLPLRLTPNPPMDGVRTAEGG